MGSPVYLKCGGCGKLNPVYGEVIAGGEYTCVFCGQLFKAPARESVVVDEKRRSGGKKPMRKAVKPENRNMRKPMI